MRVRWTGRSSAASAISSAKGDGLRARLTVEFPWLVGPAAVAAHRRHLACEFSAWIEAATADDR